MGTRKVVLLGLNEINFEYVEKYILKGYLPNFKKLIENHGYKQTSSENEYKLLEPWIQWVTIHTGKTFAEHQVFRLGDIVYREDLKQLWEIAEEKGLSVAAVSPFNAKNNLKKSTFFVPDPWTKTTTSGTPFIHKLSAAVSAAVNGNAANKIGVNEALVILTALLKYVPLKRKMHYVTLLLGGMKRKATKAAILDNLLADVYLALWKQYTPDFSSLFLNSGAHEQHHYMFNSEVYDGPLKNPEWYCEKNDDPLLDILKEYDMVIGNLLGLNVRLFIATGLHQKPHQHSTFYWRLKDHASFLGLIGINNYSELSPRMSRDFLVVFDSKEKTDQAEAILSKVTLNGERVFTIDNRELSLFIELSYSKDIKNGECISVGSDKTNINLRSYIAFVAIKNGEHDPIGYFIDTDQRFEKDSVIPLTDVFHAIKNTF